MKHLQNYFLVFLSVLLLCHEAISQKLGFNIADGNKRVSIPFELRNNLIIIPVILNNKLPLKFILDTGVRTAILTEKTFSDILQLSYNKKISVSGAGGEKLVEAYITNNISLMLPGISSKGHAMLVLEKDYLQLSNNLGTAVHGILGYELFSRFIVKINFSSRTLTLIEPDDFKLKKRYRKIPITVEDTKPFFHSNIKFHNGTDINAKLLIDTGASHSLLLETRSDEKIKIPEKNINGYLGRGLAGDIEGKVARVSSIDMGGYVFEDVIASFPESNSYADSLIIGSTFRNGTIGGGVLTRFNLIFNFPKEELYVKKNSTFKKPFDYNLSGLSIIATGKRLSDYKIHTVREGSPAYHGGLQKGDILLKINNVSVQSLSLSQVNGLFNFKRNKKIKVQLMREDKLLKTDVTLKSQI